MNYQYKTIHYNPFNEVGGIDPKLNQMGADGWRCIAILQDSAGVYATMERELPDLAKVSATVNKIADNIVKYKKKHAEEEETK